MTVTVRCARCRGYLGSVDEAEAPPRSLDGTRLVAPPFATHPVRPADPPIVHDCRTEGDR